MKNRMLGVGQILLGLFFLFILTASILILVQNYKSGDKLMEKQISDTYINILEERKATIELEAVRVEALFNTILFSEEVIDLLAEENTPYWKAAKILAFRDYVSEKTFYSDLFSVYVVGFNGIRFYYNDIMFALDPPIETTHWYQEALDLEENIHWFGLYASEVVENTNLFVVSKQIKQLISGETRSLGVAYISLNEDFLRHSLRDISREGSVSVVDREDKIIFSNDKGIIGKKAYSLNMDMGEEGAHYYIRDKGKESSLVLVSSANVYGWRIVHERPYFLLVSQFRFLKYLLYVVIAFSLLFLLMFIIVYFLKVDVPLRHLHEDMVGFMSKRLVSNSLQPKTSVKDICEEANTMLRRITFYMHTIDQIKDEIYEQELGKLQAQISPHFLNNTLNNIKFMAMLGNQPKISNIVHSLLRLLESNLSSKDKLIPLKNEIKNVMHYVNIINMIYENHIKFTFNLNNKLDNYLVPKFILQPIVENAIYHGIDPNGSSSGIEVTSYVLEDYLYLEVSDKGVGLSQKAISEILVYEHHDEEKIGIMNTDRKIKLLYGDTYGLDIKSEEGRGTRVIMKLPLVLEKSAAAIDSK